jgi:hypothetical protein
VATIHRALKRNHLISPHPPRRRKATKRLERDLVNDFWQIDATQILLAPASRPGSSTAWTITPASCSRPSPAPALPGKPPGPASRAPAPPTASRASCSPTTTQGSPVACSSNRSRSSAQARRGRRRADQRRPGAPADAGQARTLPRHAQGMAARRGPGASSRGRHRASAVNRRPLTVRAAFH